MVMYDDMDLLERLWEENNRLISKLIDELNELRAEVDNLKKRKR